MGKKIDLGDISANKKTITLRTPDGHTYRWPLHGHVAFRDLVIPEAVSRGLASLDHPVVRDWISDAQHYLRESQRGLRLELTDVQGSKKLIAECERKLKAVGGTALIAAAKKDFKNIRAMRARRKQHLKEEAKSIYVVWKPLKDVAALRRLDDGTAKAAKDQRKQEVLKLISEHWGSATIFTPTGADEYETTLRAFQDGATHLERAHLWIDHFEKCRQTDKALDYAVNEQLAKEFRGISPDSLRSSARLGRSKLRKKI